MERRNEQRGEIVNGNSNTINCSLTPSENCCRAQHGRGSLKKLAHRDSAYRGRHRSSETTKMVDDGGKTCLPSKPQIKKKANERGKEEKREKKFFIKFMLRARLRVPKEFSARFLRFSLFFPPQFLRVSGGNAKGKEENKFKLLVHVFLIFNLMKQNHATADVEPPASREMFCCHFGASNN